MALNPLALKRAAAIVDDAERDGDKAACQKHGITDRTLRRYRAALGKSRPSPIPVQPPDTRTAAEKKAVTDAQLQERVKWTRFRLLDRMDLLAQSSDDLKAVAGAYKLITDGQLARDAVLPHTETPRDGQPLRDPGHEGANREGAPAGAGSPEAVH